MSTLAPTLQSFFTDRLLCQRHSSTHTIAAYRDTMRLLLTYTEQQTGKPPCNLDLADLDAPLIAAFLHHLEHERRNSVQTRNARLAAIHSLFRFAALKHPEHAALIQRVLAIPPKRCDRTIVTYLTEPETHALLAAPDRATWTGRRDHAILLLAVQTGLRVSEIAQLRRQDLELGTGSHVRCLGKGRKERCTPLTRTTLATLRTWLREHDIDPPEAPLFPSRSGRALTRGAIWRLVTKHAATASETCASLRAKHVTPHTLRHTTAMTLLHSGVDTSIIALWLGHEGLESTNIYLHADMALKERALARTTPPNTTPGRYQAPDAVLAFLASL
jgi:integrase/recombinase XerD